MAKFAAVAAFAGLLGTSTAFAPTGVALRGSHAVPSISQRPQVGSGVLASRRLSVDAAGAGRRTSASFGALKMSANIEEEEVIEKIAFLEIPKNFDPKTKSMDEWFEQLGADENIDRTLAAWAIYQLHMEDGQEKAVIDRLFGMLTLKDVLHRRAAVQCLGMCGWKVLPRTQELMMTTDCMTTRASCSKVMGAVALRNPETLPDFPQDALLTMKKAMTEIPDPVTKVASMSALAQIAGGDMANGHLGNEKALQIIVDLGGDSEDVSLLMSVANALASIARSNPQWKERIMDDMEKMQEEKKGIEGFDMVGGILRTQLMTLSGGVRGRDFPEPSNAGLGGGFADNWGFGDDDDDDDDDEDWDSVAADMKKRK